ncbi:MAG: Rrf2 family transcriptional regulator [Clostridia bacterium]
MQITTEIDNAIRIVYFMSSEKSKIEAQRLAEISGVPIRFTVKILRKLKLSGIVKSIKGVHGGYLLNKSPEEISFLDVINAISGEIYINKCMANDFCCTRPDIKKTSECEIHKFLNELNEEISTKLRNKTFNMFN